MKIRVSENRPDRFCVVNLREIFSLYPGLEPGSSALRTGSLLTAPPRRTTRPSQNFSLSLSPLTSGLALAPFDRNRGEHLC